MNYLEAAKKGATISNAKKSQKYEMIHNETYYDQKKEMGCEHFFQVGKKKEYSGLSTHNVLNCANCSIKYYEYVVEKAVMYAKINKNADHLIDDQAKEDYLHVHAWDEKLKMPNKKIKYVCIATIKDCDKTKKRDDGICHIFSKKCNAVMIK